jgi:hypothetical protein
MKTFATHDPNGKILYVFRNVTEEMATLTNHSNDGMVEIDGDAEVLQDKHFIQNGILVERPAKPEIPNTAVSPWVIPLNSLASGAVVTVSREYGPDIVITDLSEVWDIEDAGTYLISIEQSFPHHSVTHEIVIEAATSGGL